MSQNDAQGSLLQYYSSGTTAHATHLLTFVLIGAALLALGQVLQRCALIIVLSAIVAASIWTGLRILYWGSLANNVIYVDPRAHGSMEAMHQRTVYLAGNNPKLYRRLLFRFGSNSIRDTFPLVVICFLVALGALVFGGILR